MTSRSTTLENLPAGTGYQVQVRSVSDVGAGPYSDVGTQITHQHITTTTTKLLGKHACIVESHKQNSRNPDFGTQ